ADAGGSGAGEGQLGGTDAGAEAGVGPEAVERRPDPDVPAAVGTDAAGEQGAGAAEPLTTAPTGGTTGDGATSVGGTATESKPKRLPRFRKTDDLTNDLRERARAGTLESEESVPLMAELER